MLILTNIQIILMHETWNVCCKKIGSRTAGLMTGSWQLADGCFEDKIVYLFLSQWGCSSNRLQVRILWDNYWLLYKNDYISM